MTVNKAMWRLSTAAGVSVKTPSTDVFGPLAWSSAVGTLSHTGSPPGRGRRCGMAGAIAAPSPVVRAARLAVRAVVETDPALVDGDTAAANVLELLAAQAELAAAVAE